MEYVYAALLLHSAGKEINEDNLAKVLKAPGIDVNEAKVKALVASLEGVNIGEAIKKAAIVPSAPAVSAAAPAAASEAEKKEKKEKDKEESEEEALAGLGALFG